MNKQEVRNIVDDIKRALDRIGKEHDIDIKMGGVTFSEAQFVTKLTAKVKNLNGKSLEQVEFEAYCGLFGFKENDYRRVANKPNHGRTLCIVGFKPSSPKFTLIAEDINTREKIGLTSDARSLWGIEVSTWGSGGAK